ncbi:hypothetical protein BKA61DRAFT_635220 [Leptodontidium sp. MPI-SDFR-AT-0119]|nr:hypothetical protein BKA61DRAFT_635220 [Leptodontidium sp. MPI-SDFR-AT-0119]
MLGKISLEEAYEIPRLTGQNRDQAALYIAPRDLDRYMRQIKAEKHAIEVNNYIAGEIKDNRDRLGAFVALSIHDLVQAGKELTRCVKELSFYKSLLNNTHFAKAVSLYILGMITQGVFDRFLNLKLEDIEKPLAAKAREIIYKITIYNYFKKNIWVTTSRHFYTPTLKYVADYLGPEKILSSEIKSVLGWKKGYEMVRRENAKALSKLRKFYDSEVRVE